MSKQTSNNPSGSWKMILLLIIVGAAALMISPYLQIRELPLPHRGISHITWEKKWFSVAIIMIRIPRTSS